MDQLPQADRAELERILLINPSEMSEDEVAFLRARRNYLTFPQKESYKDVLNLSAEELAPQVDPAVAEEATQYTDPSNAQQEVAATQEEVSTTEETAETPAQEVQEDVQGLQAAEQSTEVNNAQSEEVNPYGVDDQQAENLAE